MMPNHMEEAIRRWLIVAIKGCKWSAAIFRQAVAFKAWLTEGPRKHYLHHYTTSSSMGSWNRANWVDGFTGTKFWSYHLHYSEQIPMYQLRVHFSSPVIGGGVWVCVCCSLKFQFLANSKEIWHGIMLLAHQSQGLMCWDAFLLTTVV